MVQVIAHSPSQTATFYLETKDSDGYWADGYYQDGYTIDGYESPIIQKIILPDFTEANGYPQAMTKFDTGIYYAQITLPSGGSAVGSYFVIIAYREPDTYLLKFQEYQVVVTAPFGLYSVTTS